jgi:hypothetical protein
MCRAAHQIAVAELHCHHLFAERQLKLVARIRASEHAGDCASACCSSAVSQGVRLAGRPRCRATQQRAPPTRGGQAVSAAGHLARCRTPAGAHRRQRARVAHTTGLSVSSRCCWCWCARCAQERSGSPLDDTLSQRELPHLAHKVALLHMHVLSSERSQVTSSTIADVAQV